jgi:hypothetical protein
MNLFKKLFFYTLFILLIFLCLRNIYYSIDYFSHALKTHNWLKTSGVIVKSDTGEMMDEKTQQPLRFYPIIEYVFGHNKEYIVSSNLFWNKSFYKMVRSDSAVIDNITADFPLKSKVHIFFNPQNPYECALIRTDLKSSGFVLFLSIVFFVLLFPGFNFLHKNFIQ